MRDVFESLADPTRRHIVELLSLRDRSVGELCDEFEISQPAVSRHLRLLREAGLVASRSDAQRRVYKLQPAPLEEIERWLQRYRSYWCERLDDLESVLRDEQPRRRRREAKQTKGKETK